MRRNYQKFVDEFLTETGMSGAEMARAIGLTADTIQGLRRGSISSPQHTTKQKINRFVLNYRKENKTKMTPQTQGHLFENLFETQVQTSELTLTAEDGTQYVSSRSVAEWTEKRHSDLIRDIENYISYLKADEAGPKAETYFVEGTYQIENGRSYKMYWCSSKGCEMIANKMTGKKGVLFTLNSVERLNRIDQEGSFKMDDIFGDIFQTSDNFGNVLNLVEVDGVPYTTSRMMALKFNKDHSNVLKELDRINNGVSEISLTPLYIESTYIHEQNKQEYREILVSKKGCLLYMFNIQGYQAEKVLFIESFERMEQALKAETTPAPEKLTEPVETAQTAPELPQGLREVERLYMDTLAQEIAKTDDMAVKMQLAERLTQLVQSMN